MNSFVQDILSRRNLRISGGDSIWYLEAVGANIIEPTAFEPDPNNHRHQYYYNAQDNALYRKKAIGSDTNVWEKMR